MRALAFGVRHIRVGAEVRLEFAFHLHAWRVLLFTALLLALLLRLGVIDVSISGANRS